MMARCAILTVMILSVSTMALAQSGNSQQMGTPEQRAACGPDVRKFCHHVKESDGADAYLQCLELNRDNLSAKCIAMLQNYGK
jgi:hypothetical protein